MVQRVVEVEALLGVAPEAVWAVLGDFARAWHPWIGTMQEERDPRGAVIRAFTVQGDSAFYREQLTWLSESDRELGYTHLAGIAECDAYDARLCVTAEGSGSRIIWSAVIEAAEPRLSQICDGTEAVFKAGIAALDGIMTAEPARMDRFVASPLPPRETRFLGGNPRLCLTTAGGQGKRLCLFLHGIGGNRGNWDLQLAAASGVMSAAALDLRGYGGSQLGPAPSTVADYCDDILRVMRAMGAGRLVLVGLSYGSWIATSFAMRYPELLDGLVLSGGCTGMSEAGEAEREAFRISREVPLDAGKTPRDFAPSVVDILAGPNAGEALRAQLFDSMAAIPAATYRDALRCFTTPPERFDFSRLTMPVLMMTGEYDRLAPPAEIRAVARRIHAAAPRANVQFEVIPDAGHLCNLEEPGLYNRHLTAFLGRLP